LLSVVTIAIGIIVFVWAFPDWAQRLPLLVVVLIFGATCASAWGDRDLADPQEAAPAIINVLLFPLLFISGTFAAHRPGSFVDHLAQLFPVWHFNRAIEWVFSEQATDGAWRPRYLPRSRMDGGRRGERGASDGSRDQRRGPPRRSRRRDQVNQGSR
jgi:ABC-2 type transport system permease protein